MKRLLALLTYAALLASALYLQASHTRPESKDNSRFDEPDARYRWELLRLADPKTGEIPYAMRAREIAFADRMNWRAMKQQSATIYSDGWKFAGPVNAGGRAQTVGIDVANEANIVVATAAGGIWRSEDSGLHWIKASQPDQLQDCFSLVQDHRAGKTGTWYCGTGELLSTTFRRVQVTTMPRWRTLDVGDGIYKSGDNGKSWSLLSSTFDTSRVVLDSAFDGVWNIVVDNSNSSQDIVYAAGYGAIMRSTDAGAHWAKVLGDAHSKSLCTDVEISSQGVLYAYMSTTGTGTPTTAGIWRSTNGTQWTRITPSNWPSTTARMKLAIAPSNENIVYIAGEAPMYTSGHSIWKYEYLSGDGSGSGGTWDDRSSSLPTSTNGANGINTLGGYALALAVHPRDPDLVYLGGTNVFRSPNGFADDLSTEWIGGYNSDPTGPQSYPNHHPDNHCFAFSTAQPDRMYNCNDAGVFVTEDARAETSDDPDHPVTWKDLNTGLQASLIYTVALDRGTAGREVLAGGFQDQGAWIGNPNEPWSQLTGGDGCYTAMADGGQTVYTSSQFATIYRLRFDPALNFLSYSFIPPRMTNPQFVAPWLIDPVDNAQMYVADSNMIWWNNNLEGIPDTNYDYTNTNWSPLGKTLINRACVIGALAMSRQPAHILFYGASDGHVYKLTDPTATPIEITSPSFPKNAFVSCISIDPESAANIVVTFSNYHVRSIFATSDGGANWRDISGNLEEHPDGSGDGPSVRWATIVHQKRQTLYLVGTSVGLYSSTDITGNPVWQQESAIGIGRTIVEHMDVRESDGFVGIATQGAGMWYGYVKADSLASATPIAESVERVELSCNPVKTSVTLRLQRDASSSVELYDAAGREVAHASGNATVSVDCSDLPNGTYAASIHQEGRAIWRRFVVRH